MIVKKNKDRDGHAENGGGDEEKEAEDDDGLAAEVGEAGEHVVNAVWKGSVGGSQIGERGGIVAVIGMVGESEDGSQNDDGKGERNPDA